MVGAAWAGEGQTTEVTGLAAMEAEAGGLNTILWKGSFSWEA